MPTLFTIDGYRFFFYSNEHRPIHVHVVKGETRAKIEVESDIETVSHDGLNSKELAKIERIVAERRDEIIKAWLEFHG